VVVCHLQNTTKHDHVAFLVVVGADPRPQVVIEDSSDEEDEEPSAPEEFAFKKPNVLGENDINTADPAELNNDGQ
jgi:hypothetical protein